MLDIRGNKMRRLESGSVLAISLILLTAITVIAMMGMQRAGLQTKIVGAIQQQELTRDTNNSEIHRVYRATQYSETQALSDALNSIDNTTTTTSGINWNARLYQVETTITHIQPSLEAGKIATSSLRDNNSRGKNGAGIEKFEISSETTLRNGVNSVQTIGMRYLMPE